MIRWVDYLDNIPERYCRKCDEWWPEAEEFFYFNKGKFVTPCRACQLEQKQEASTRLSCSKPGCQNPRHCSKNGRYESYCTEHRYYIRTREAQAVQP